MSWVWIGDPWKPKPQHDKIGPCIKNEEAALNMHSTILKKVDVGIIANIDYSLEFFRHNNWRAHVERSKRT